MNQDEYGNYQCILTPPTPPTGISYPTLFGTVGQPPATIGQDGDLALDRDNGQLWEHYNGAWQ